MEYGITEPGTLRKLLHVCRRLFINAYPDDRYPVFSILFPQIIEYGKNTPAGNAPHRPEIQDHDLPPVVGQGMGFAFEIGKGVEMNAGDDVTLIGTGFALHRAYDAAMLLQEEGIHARLINIHTIRPLDRELILKAAEETGRIVTVEEHYVVGGLGSAVAELLAVEHPVPMRIIGIPHGYAENGPYEELLEMYGMLPEQIATTVKAFIGA